jgi:RNA polymerase sigma-70 factor (ECF subfamily)
LNQSHSEYHPEGIDNTHEARSEGAVAILLPLVSAMKTSIQDEIKSDAQLLELSRRGDCNAFSLLVSQYYRSCVNLASAILKNRSEAEDQVQEATWKAFRHLDQYLGQAEFYTWLFQIVINQCRMLMRAKKRARFLYLNDGPDGGNGRATELLSPTADPEHQVVKTEMIEVLQSEIRRIPPLLRQMIQLRDIEGLPMPDIADRLQITVPAAKSRLLRARRELRDRVLRRCGPAKHMMPLSPEQTVPARPGKHACIAA